MCLGYFIASLGSASASDVQIGERGNESYEAATGRTTKKLESVFGGRTSMLWTIFVILLVLWALGLITSYTVGGFIHILLVLAIVVLVIRLVQGQRLA